MSPDTESASRSAHAARFSLLGDQPHEGTDDPLGFQRIAKSLAALVLDSRDATPLTIGIEAGWGMGKSSLMRGLARQLEGRDDVTTVWFNAWTAQEGDALEGLLKSVLNRLDANVLRRALRNKRVTALARAAGRVAANWAKVGPLVDELWNQAKIDPKARNELEVLVRAAMEEWTAKAEVTGGRLFVVFIDDLDRCPPTNVFQIFEAVKLYLNAAGFVFVIGYDQDVVSDAILHEKHYSSHVRSRDYLEKIVQIDYAVPTPSEPAGRKLLDDCLRDSRIGELVDHPARTLLLERNDRNPRRIKRFLNAFILEYEREPDRTQEDAGRLIRWLVLRMYFPGFTILFRDRKAQPVKEFFAYRDARQALRAAGNGEVAADDLAKVQAAFKHYGIGLTEDDPAAALERLDREVPEAFPKLVVNTAFSSLVEPLREEPERKWLADMLESRPAPPIMSGAGAGAAPPDVALAGLSILWIDDNPEGNLRLVERLRDSGAHVAEATGFADAFPILGSAAIDVIVSDISRDGRPDAGFDDLRKFQAAERGRPTVFFTARVTPSRRERAEKLGAEITADTGELLRVLQAFATRRADRSSRDRPLEAAAGAAR